MLSKIVVGEGWKKYKQDAEIPPGTYLVYKGKPTDKDKKIYEMIPASPPSGGFLWLLPAERWVIECYMGRVKTQPPERVPVDWKLIGVDPSILRPWQREAVEIAYTDIYRFGKHRRGWVVSLGGGKTLTGLMLCQMFEKPLVLVDRYLHQNWKQQAKQWNLTCPNIATYESAHKYEADCLIIDECARVKNPTAQRSVRIREIAKKADLVVGLTGIPTAGKGPLDFRWLRCVDPESVPEKETTWQFRFGKDTVLKEVGGNKAYVTTQWDDKAIAEFVSPYISTVDTSDLLKDLPEIEERYISCPKPSQFDLIAGGAATTSGTMKRLAQTRQCTDGFIYDDEGNPKRLSETDSKVKRIVDFVETLGEPILIYSTWTEGVKLISEALSEYKPSIISEGTDAGKAIERFQKGETKVMVANAAYACGMNLQHVCRVVAFTSLSSKPDLYQQAIGRIYRPGQKKGCIIVYFVCEDTLDRRVIELVKAHTNCSDEFIDKLLFEEMEKYAKV